MKQWIFWGNELTQRGVYKDATLRKLVENKIQGDVGYTVFVHEVKSVVYNAEFDVWHDPRTTKLEHYGEILRAPREEHCSC
jgi:hypothetical protein